MRTAKKRAFALTMARREAIAGLFFISLFIIGLLIFFIPGIVRSIMLCFSQNDANFALEWIGLENFHFIFRVDPHFVRETAESIGGVLADSAVVILYSLFICTLLNREMRGKGALRALLFLPVVMSMGVIEKYMGYTVRDASVLDTVSESAGGGFSLNNIEAFMAVYSISADLTGFVIGALRNIQLIISHSGVQVVIFLAGLQSISKSVYEASRVEGCSAWETYWKITIPMLTPVIAVNVVYTVVDSFTRSDNIVMGRVISYLTEYFRFGIASAMAWVYFLVLIILLAIVMAVLRKFTYYENN